MGYASFSPLSQAWVMRVISLVIMLQSPALLRDRTGLAGSFAG